ncbi:MAG: prepilin peptidase [Mailhella sp.]
MNDILSHINNIDIFCSPETFAILSAILGLIFGSFFNVCIFRFISKESIVYPPSHCTVCGHTLNALDLIPVLSWLFLRGRCRYCHSPISAQYVIVELLTALIFFLTALSFGFSTTAAVYLVFSSLFIVASGIDSRIFILPDAFTLGTALPAFLAAVFLLDMPWKMSLAGGLAASGVFLTVQLLFSRIRGMEGLGWGDIKLMLPLGFLCGLPLIPMATLLSGMLALLAFPIIHAAKGGNLRTMRIPFGPFLCAGAWLTWLYGKPLMQMWLTFLGV